MWWFKKFFSRDVSAKSVWDGWRMRTHTKSSFPHTGAQQKLQMNQKETIAECFLRDSRRVSAHHGLSLECWCRREPGKQTGRGNGREGMGRKGLPCQDFALTRQRGGRAGDLLLSVCLQLFYSAASSALSAHLKARDYARKAALNDSSPTHQHPPHPTPPSLLFNSPDCWARESVNPVKKHNSTVKVSQRQTIGVASHHHNSLAASVLSRSNVWKHAPHNAYNISDTWAKQLHNDMSLWDTVSGETVARQYWSHCVSFVTC